MKKLKILVVEDDEEINNLIFYALKKEGYDIVQFFHGREAIEKYNNTFDLVILDLMLPYVNFNSKGVSTFKIFSFQSR